MKRGVFSKRSIALVLVASLSTGFGAQNVYAQDMDKDIRKSVNGSEQQFSDSGETKGMLIIPNTMEITEAEAADIAETVKLKIEEINSVTIVSVDSVVRRFGNTATVDISVTSSDRRTGEGRVNVTIAGEENKGDLIIPSTMEIYEDEASDISKAVKRRIEEINNVTIVSMSSSISQVGNIARVATTVESSDGRTGSGNINVTIVKRPIVIFIPDEVNVKEGYSIEEEITKEVYKLNNPAEIQSIQIEIINIGEAIVVVTDTEGKVTSKAVKIVIIPNNLPIIEVVDKVIKVGDKFNPLDGVIATDLEDGDLTSKIEVVESTVDTTKEGEYKVVYKVTDNQGGTFTKGIKVKVELGLIGLNNAPKIEAVDRAIKVGDIFNPLKGVVALDVEDGDITSKIQVVENTVDTTKKGEYRVVYKVTDSQGASFTKEIKIKVELSLIGLNSAPKIEAVDKVIKAGEAFNPLKDVIASDLEDGDITSMIEVAENTVDTTIPGEYKVVYKVSDSEGATFTKEIKVTVNKIKTGWVKEAGKWYYLNESGEMHKGWLNLKGTWYYLKDNGEMATGWLKLGGTWYYLQPGGQMATGWLNLSGTWYYLQPGGQMATGWLNLGGTWYYLQPGGQMATGWQRVNGKWYYMNIYGAMETGWVRVNSSWYYLNAYGEMVTGWAYINNNWYYMYISGVMAANTVINGWNIDAYGIARQ
ncbi:MAG: DUF5011 domain-containing protein [Clostridium sp.]|nr:DUF5011 domain-containing protein [Clostridium sp.]MDU7084342.1 DUF5011 domain-containing protein [Clostridium sp.]